MTSRITAWGITSVTVLLALVAVALLIVNPAPSNFGPGSLLWPLPFAAMAVVGGLVASRHPGNTTGWLFVAAAFLMIANAFGQAYIPFAGIHHLPGVHLLAWVSLWSWAPASGLIGVILMVFPSGRPPGPRWRWVVWAAYAVVALIPVSAIFTWGAPTHQLLAYQTSDVVVRGSEVLTPLLLSIQVLLPIGFVALVVRFVRSRGVERQQLKWFVYGTSFVAISILISIAIILISENADPISNPVDAAFVLAGMTAIPVSAGIGILRYRLYDIDRIISRTLSYALVTGVLAGTFALVALVPTAVLGTSKRPDWVVAAGTLAVAALFRPVRRRVQNAVDHRFNRKRYDAEQTVETFAQRLRQQIDIDALGAELCAVVNSTMQPSRVSLWLPGKP